LQTALVIKMQYLSKCFLIYLPKILILLASLPSKPRAFDMSVEIRAINRQLQSRRFNF